MLLAERLVGEARERRKRRMDSREQAVDAVSAVVFIAVAAVLAGVLPSERETEPAIVLGLIAAHAVVSRVRFEFGEGYVSPEQLVLVPMLLLLPLPLVPFLIVVGAVLGTLPDITSGAWHRQRWLTSIADSWFCVGPVLVLAALAPGEPALAHAEVYVLALVTQLAGGFLWALIRDQLLHRRPVLELARNVLGANRVDAILSPIGLMATLAAVEAPWALLGIAPLVWLLELFSRDRQERYTATLELNRAYRGTVMLLADVVEFEDGYTANHSRSVVELVQAVSDEMGVHESDRQELEFAALLHDVGKIAIPKEILYKSARLTAEEFEVMKRHTIEGQYMLDRIGGLLGRVGEIVRSCHERWDGTGYPDGLREEQIPLAARIVFACDAYDAMTTDRPYRLAMSRAEALDELTSNAGTQFDPDVVSVLTKIVEQLKPEPAPADEVRAVLAGARLPRRVGAAT